MQLTRPIRPETAALCAAAFFVAVVNIAFWRQFYAIVAPRNAYELLFIATTVVVAFCLLALLFGALSFPYLFKPALAALLLLTSAAAYFINEYGIVIDEDMIRNVAETNRAETADLITLKLVLYVLVLGALPAVVLCTRTIAYRPFLGELWFKTKAAALIVAIVALAAFPFMQNITSVFREHRILMHVFTPLNYLSAAAEYGKRQLRSRATAVAPFGQDAHKAAVWAERKRRSLTILVIGETARAPNFSLNGYGRETNPLLSKVPGLITYSKAYSCGTSTAQSLPCMFSGQSRAGFINQRAAPQEGLLHILQRAGFSVLWRENQGGCAGVCKGVPTDIIEGAGNRKLFELGDSHDENLLHGLQAKIDGMQGDAVVVLHMMGSHGPAYYKRYPQAFERFQPACKDSQFSRCARAEIVNSYDNTIVYTDYVLARIIELLQASDSHDVPSAMIYVSDHGESLGESNVYLHGLPYALAPDVQKHVPLLMWLSPKLQADFRVDTACLDRHRHEPVSHDNFFHSVLGLLDVGTRVYDRGLDIFARCRSISRNID